MELRDTDKSLDKVFRLAELNARLGTLATIMKGYVEEIREIVDETRRLFGKSDDSPPT